MLDEEELLDARWMSAEEVEARCEAAEDEGKPLAGKVSRGNWEMIRHALEGARTHLRWRLQPHMHMHPCCVSLQAVQLYMYYG